MRHTQAQIDRAVRKVEQAIDRLVELQDMGFGCDSVTRILEQLNSLAGKIRAAQPEAQ